MCFVGTLITDIVYWQTAAMLWADMSDWLLLAGLLVVGDRSVGGLIDFLARSSHPPAARCLDSRHRQCHRKSCSRSSTA